jgi:uncharacterized protein (TIGR02117 family)
VYVVTHGWHTGVALRAADIDFARWPLPRPARAPYIEVGWGDRDYYPARGFNAWYAFKALFWPTASVLHVVGFDEPPARAFASSDVVELRVARAGFERLLDYIASSFEPGAEPIAPGLYGRGGFYPSRETFHLFKTCNVWVARALREAGIDVAPSLLPEGLMAQLRQLSAQLPGPPGWPHAPQGAGAAASALGEANTESFFSSSAPAQRAQAGCSPPRTRVSKSWPQERQRYS